MDPDFLAEEEFDKISWEKMVKENGKPESWRGEEELKKKDN